MKTPTTAAEINQAREAMRPAGAITIRLRDNAGVAYWLKRKDGAITVMALNGRAWVRPSHCYKFRNEARAAAWVSDWTARLTAHQDKRKADAAARKAFRHSLEVGDVLVSVWGYEQTNVDYYQVTRRSDSCVWARPITAQIEATGDMQGRSVPTLGKFTGEERRYRVGTSNQVKVRSYSWATKIEPVILAGVKTFPQHNWTAYA